MLTVTILLIGQPPVTGPFSLAHVAGLGKYVYGNGFTVMERLSGTLLMAAVRAKLSSSLQASLRTNKNRANLK